MHQEREDYYLLKYLPLLNTIFKSNLNDTQTYDSLYENLDKYSPTSKINIKVFLFISINMLMDNLVPK